MQKPGDRAVSAVRTERHKFVFTSRVELDAAVEALRAGEPVSGRYQVFGLKADALERDGLSENHEQIAKELSGRLANWLVAPSRMDHHALVELIDEETNCHLRALGYIE